MSYPFVHAATDLGVARGPRLALVVHMAEGGGTVGFLSRPNPDDVSVHYVIEYAGRIVQMLLESHMHSSIRTTAIRKSDDADGFFGWTAALATLGDWANTAKTLGPNHATLAVEIEGFAAKGPNDDQIIALQALIADLRTRYPRIGLLGHRDFQDYKACPGRLIPWPLLGGHGPAKEEDMVPAAISDETPALVDVNVGVDWYDLDNTTKLFDGLSAPLVDEYSPYVVGTLGAGGRRAIFVTLKGLHRLVLVSPSAVKPVPPADCTQAIADARAAEHELVRTAAIAAVEVL
ncbi:MAG TPA: peptidoglycan recognition family protein [Candidatus Limnocylindrales bacterium]|jgi:hypothetical protein|nr:peptidoglycan recognition family protein [Candidatus Limnocylindrales bacterium]